MDETQAHGESTPGGDRLLQMLGALANPHRLRVVAELSEGRQYVSELARRLGIGRPLLHMHLQKLEAAGLVTGSMAISPEGKAMKYYDVADFVVTLTPTSIAEAATTLSRRDTNSEEDE